MANVYKASIDIKDVRPDFKPIFVQYDHAQLEIELTDNGQIYDLSNVDRVEFTHFRSDDLVIIQPGEIVINDEGKFIRYEYLGSEMEVLGTVKTSLALFDTANKKVSSHTFDVGIVKDLREIVFEPGAQNYGRLQTLIDDVEYLKLNGGGGEVIPGPPGPPGYTPIKGIDYNDGLNGEKGDPFTYDDFTPDQLEALRGPEGPPGNIEFPTFIDEIDTPFNLISGYRASSSGQLMTNSNTWRTTPLIRNVGTNVYNLPYTFDSIIPGIRILQYTGGTGGQYLGSYTTTVNRSFTVNENVTFFAINFPLLNASPNTTPPLGPSFNTVEAVESIKLVRLEEKEDKFVANSVFNQSINEVKEIIRNIENVNPGPQTLKVLMVGNSFSEDVSNYIHLISNSVNIDVIFGNLHVAGETLQGHLNHINTNANVYNYHKRTSLNGVVNHTTTENATFLNSLRDESWDVIVYQQASHFSGMYSTFTPYLTSIIQFVNANKLNPNSKNALHMTWAYPVNSSHGGFANYNNNQITMYNAIVNAYLQAMREHDIDILIPTGTAVQNARTINYLQLQNNDMASDDFHLGEIGDFIGGLTLFEALIASKYNKDIFEDVNYTVESKFLSYLSKVAVKNAIQNPFKVTNFNN